MVKLTPRQVAQMSIPTLKKWLTDRDQKLPKVEQNKTYYIDRVLDYQLAHENDDSDVDMGPQVQTKSNRSTPSRLVNKRKTPIRNRRHSDMPAGYSDKKTPNRKSTNADARVTRSRRRTLDPGDLESSNRSRSRRNNSRKNRGLFLSKPADQMKKVDLQDWLSQNDISYSSSMRKAELVKLVESHAMSAPDTPPKKQRTFPTRNSPKRQLDDKTKPAAKRVRHSFQSKKFQSIMADSSDDDADGDQKVDDQLPITPQTRRDGPLPDNLELSPLTPQQPQDTVEKQGSTSPPMRMQPNSSVLLTPAFLRKVREDGPKGITDDYRNQVRSAIRDMLDEDEPTKPQVSSFSGDYGNESPDSPQVNSKPYSLEHKEDPPLTRNLDFGQVHDDSSDADEEKTDLVQTRLPNPPSSMLHRPPKKPRRASAPSAIPHQHIKFNPKVTGQRPNTRAKKGNSSWNYLLGAVVIAVLSFTVYVFFSLENTVRFCDTGKTIVKGFTDIDGEPVPCELCPDRAECAEGAAVCDTQYVLIGTECVLNRAVVQAGYEIRSQVFQILSEVRGRHECGEDIEKGYSENQLKDLIDMADSTLADEAFDYFKENILPSAATIKMEGDKYVSTRPIKSLACQAREWAGDNKLLLCSSVGVALMVLAALFRCRRAKRNQEMALNLKMQVMDVLQDRARSGRREKHLAIDTLKNEFRPPEEVWRMVIEMLNHEHNVVKKQMMVQGVQRSCWEMTDISARRRHHRASLDPAMTTQWRRNNQQQNMFGNSPPSQAHHVGWTAAPPSNNFGGHPQFDPASPQTEGVIRTGDNSQSASELFDQNRRQANQFSAQQFVSSQGDGDEQGQGFQLRRFPPTSAR